MTDNTLKNEIDVKLILSSVRALWGSVTPYLRSVSVELRDKTIVWQCIFDSEATEEDLELLSEAATEVIADFNDYELKELIKRVPNLHEVDNLRNLIYLRHG